MHENVAWVRISGMPMSDTGIPARVRELSSAAQDHAVERRFDQAVGCFEQALALLPDDPDLLLQLSYMHSLAGHYRLAHRYALEASGKQAKTPEVVKELLARLRTFNEMPAMSACIERLLPMSRISIPLLINIAAQLTYAGQPEKAIAFLDEARRGDPDYPPTLLSRAHVLMFLGRFAEAGEDLERALKRAPQLAQGYWLQSQVRKQSAGGNHVERIIVQMQVPQRSQQDLALLGFALHKELDDLGRHDEAWRALQQGSASKRSSLRYDAAQTRRMFEGLHRFTPRAAATRNSEAVSATPVFIVGMHRSGTTLLEQLLDGHSDVAGLGELYDFTSAMRYATDHHCSGVMDARIPERAADADFGEIGKRYLDGLAWRLRGKGYFIDKLPSNFLSTAFICEALPQAKVLHMVRDPMETCFSNLRELFSDANPYSYDQLELADFFNEYRRLMAHWHARYPGRILDVDYARLTGDPGNEIRRVCDFIGIAFEPGMLQLQSRTRGIVTASAVQVRGRIEVRETPKWLAYEKHLQLLLQRLGG
jgi:tetratricopeptide (TPR) repeat protein